MDYYAVLKERVRSTNIFSAIPNNDRDYVLDEIRRLPQNATMLEVGTFVAGTTRAMALVRPDVHVYSVDINTWESKDPMLNNIKSHYGLVEADDTTMHMIQKINTEDLHNVTLITGKSLNVDLRNIDLVYLDGDHRFEAVLKELRYFWDRLTYNGIIMGDDVNSREVYDAVRVFAFEQNLELCLYSKQFKLQKNKSHVGRKSESKLNMNLIESKRPDLFNSAI